MRAIAAVTVPAAVGLAMIGGAASASAADAAPTGHHHASKAERRHDARARARRLERLDPPRSAQDTTTTAGPDTSPRHTGPRSGSAGRVIPGVVSCAVTSAKPVRTQEGAQALVTNGCSTVRDVVISAQAQAPGPWHHGICRETGVCHELGRFTIKVLPGAHYVAIEFTACRVQVDVSLPSGKLLRAAQFGESGCKTVVPPHDGHGRPPVTHNPKHGVHQHARVRVPATSVELTALPRTGGVEVTQPVGLGLLGILAGGLLVGLTRRPAAQTAAARAALKAGEGK